MRRRCLLLLLICALFLKGLWAGPILAAEHPAPPLPTHGPFAANHPTCHTKHLLAPKAGTPCQLHCAAAFSPYLPIQPIVFHHADQSILQAHSRSLKPDATPQPDLPPPRA